MLLADEGAAIGPEADRDAIESALDLWEQVARTAPTDAADAARVMADTAAVVAEEGTDAEVDLDALARASADLAARRRQTCDVDLRSGRLLMIVTEPPINLATPLRSCCERVAEAVVRPLGSRSASGIVHQRWRPCYGFISIVIQTKHKADLAMTFPPTALARRGPNGPASSSSPSWP